MMLLANFVALPVNVCALSSALIGSTVRARWSAWLRHHCFGVGKVLIEQEMVVQRCAHQQCKHSMLVTLLLVCALVVCNSQAVTITPFSSVMFDLCYGRTSPIMALNEDQIL